MCIFGNSFSIVGHLGHLFYAKHGLSKTFINYYHLPSIKPQKVSCILYRKLLFNNHFEIWLIQWVGPSKPLCFKYKKMNVLYFYLFFFFFKFCASTMKSSKICEIWFNTRLGNRHIKLRTQSTTCIFYARFLYIDPLRNNNNSLWNESRPFCRINGLQIVVTNRNTSLK